MLPYVLFSALFQRDIVDPLMKGLERMMLPSKAHKLFNHLIKCSLMKILLWYHIAVNFIPSLVKNQKTVLSRYDFPPFSFLMLKRLGNDKSNHLIITSNVRCNLLLLFFSNISISLSRILYLNWLAPQFPIETFMIQILQLSMYKKN